MSERVVVVGAERCAGQPSRERCAQLAVRGRGGAGERRALPVSRVERGVE